jgi:hypothetical protein
MKLCKSFWMRFLNHCAHFVQQGTVVYSDSCKNYNILTGLEKKFKSWEIQDAVVMTSACPNNIKMGGILRPSLARIQN